MWLNLDLDGIGFRFCITEYQKSIPENLYKLYDQWCTVELSLGSSQKPHQTLRCDIAENYSL